MKDIQTLTADSQPKWVYATPWMTTNWSMYRPSHPFGSRGSKCLLSEVATGWKAGSGQLATPEFIYEESLLLSWWDTLYTGSARLQPGQLYCFNSETIWSQRKEMRVVVHPSHVTWCSLQTIQFTFFSPRFAACSSTGKPFSDWLGCLPRELFRILLSNTSLSNYSL